MTKLVASEREKLLSLTDELHRCVGALVCVPYCAWVHWYVSLKLRVCMYMHGWVRVPNG